MKYILLSDIHLLTKSPRSRIDDLTETQWNKLRFVFNYAAKRGFPILQAGDSCNSPRSWYLLPKFAQFLREYQNVHYYCVFGQHDTYLYSDISRSATIIGALSKTHTLTVLKPRPLKIGNTYVYGSSFGEPVPTCKHDNSILVIHAPISSTPLFKGHDDHIASRRFIKRHKFKLTLCGDIHRKSVVRYHPPGSNTRYLVNAGPMLRKEANEYNMTHKPGFFVWTPDSESLQWVEIPHKRANQVLTRESLDEAEETKETMQKLVNEIRQEIKRPKVSFKQNLQLILKKYKIKQSVKNVLTDVMEEER